jgi:hypothetical protein
MTIPAIVAVSPVQATATRAAPRAPAELPDMPKPVTPANAAVHIMKVPNSRVVEAFVSLQRAIGQQARSEAPPAAPAVERAAPLPDPAPPPAVDLEA